jgi:hypothetical protein
LRIFLALLSSLAMAVIYITLFSSRMDGAPSVPAAVGYFAGLVVVSLALPGLLLWLEARWGPETTSDKAEQQPGNTRQVVPEERDLTLTERLRALVESRLADPGAQGIDDEAELWAMALAMVPRTQRRAAPRDLDLFKLAQNLDNEAAASAVTLGLTDIFIALGAPPQGLADAVHATRPGGGGAAHD